MISAQIFFRDFLKVLYYDKSREYEKRNSPAKKCQVFIRNIFLPAGKAAKAHERNFHECPFE
jgi:hypothetical protein